VEALGHAGRHLPPAERGAFDEALQRVRRSKTELKLWLDDQRY
jgi:hypothetical protein